MVRRKVYFRADGNTIIGLGHVIRSLALADMLKDDFECHFVIRNPLNTIRKQILEVCESIINLENTDNDVQESRDFTRKYLTGEEIVVLDGYHFVTSYQQIIKDKGCKLVCIDDIHAYHFVANIVVNHALGAKGSNYSIENYTKLFLGFDYCLLRRPFREIAGHVREIKNVGGAFICFGGADYHNITLKAIKAIVEYNIDLQRIDVVVGSVNLNLDEIRNYVASVLKPVICIHSNLLAKKMCDIMARNELAIVPASTISMECQAVKLKIVCGYFVENQIKYFTSLKQSKLITPAYDYCKLSLEEFSLIIKSALRNDTNQIVLIDGKIEDRFKEIFKKI